MSVVKRRDYVAKNMKKFSRGGSHKSNKDYKRKPKYKEERYDFSNKEMY